MNMIHPSTIVTDNLEYQLEKLNDRLNKSSDSNESLIEVKNELYDLVDEVLIISEEGIITKAIARIIDGIVSTFYNLFTTFYNIFADFDTNMINNYKYMSPTSYFFIKRIKYHNVYKLMVQNSPTKLPPVKSVETLLSFYKRFDVKHIDSNIVQPIKLSSTYLERENYKDCKTAMSQIKLDTSVGEELKDFFDTNFTIVITQCPFGKMFDNMNQFFQYVSMCGENHYILKNLRDVENEMKNANNIVSKFTDNVSSIITTTKSKKDFLVTARKFSKKVDDTVSYFIGYGYLAKIFYQHQSHVTNLLESLRKTL